jgi:hypothetical protein
MLPPSGAIHNPSHAKLAKPAKQTAIFNLYSAIFNPKFRPTLQIRLT